MAAVMDKIWKFLLVLIFLYGIVTVVLNAYRYFMNLGHAKEQGLACAVAPTLEPCLKQYQFLIEANKNAQGVVSGTKSINDKINK